LQAKGRLQVLGSGMEPIFLCVFTVLLAAGLGCALPLCSSLRRLGRAFVLVSLKVSCFVLFKLCCASMHLLAWFSPMLCIIYCTHWPFSFSCMWRSPGTQLLWVGLMCHLKPWYLFQCQQCVSPALLGMFVCVVSSVVLAPFVCLIACANVTCLLGRSTAAAM
jgi:hypothetical protein